MELVRSVAKRDGDYREVLWGGERYSVFRYTGRVGAMQEVFVVRAAQYERLLARQAVRRDGYLLRITANAAAYIVYGCGGKESVQGALFGGSRIPRNGLLADLREENAAECARQSKSKGLLLRGRVEEVAGHAVELLLPRYVRVGEAVCVTIGAELAALYGAEKFGKTVPLRRSADRREALVGAAEALEEIAAHWREHAAPSDVPRHGRDYLALVRAAGLEPHSQPLGDPDAVLDAAAAALRGQAARPESAPADPLPVAALALPAAEPPDEKKVIVEEKENNKYFNDAIASSITTYSATEYLSGLVEVSYNSEELVVFKVKNIPVVMDKSIFLDLHGIAEIENYTQLAVRALKSGYFYTRAMRGFDGKRDWEYLHRICVYGYAWVNGVPRRVRAPAAPQSVDHINRVPGDNRRSNLRPASQRLQNLNQAARTKPPSAVLEKYFGLRVQLPPNLSMVASNTSNGSPLYKTLSFLEDFNIVIKFEVKLPSKSKVKISKKVNIVNIFKSQLVAQKRYEARLASVPAELLALAPDPQSHAIFLLTQPLSAAEQYNLHSVVRKDIIEKLEEVVRGINSNEKMCRELKIKEEMSDTSQKYQEYLDICDAADIEVEVDETLLCAPRYCQPFEDLIAALRGALP